MNQPFMWEMLGWSPINLSTCAAEFIKFNLYLSFFGCATLFQGHCHGNLLAAVALDLPGPHKNLCNNPYFRLFVVCFMGVIYPDFLPQHEQN